MTETLWPRRSKASSTSIYRSNPCRLYRIHTDTGHSVVASSILLILFILRANAEGHTKRQISTTYEFKEIIAGSWTRRTFPVLALGSHRNR
jgi:hypothetical protein